jgi:hypothetical protein
MKMKMMFIFLVMKPCRLIHAGSYQHFRETYCLHLQGRDSMFLQNASIYLLSLHDIKTQKKKTVKNYVVNNSNKEQLVLIK